MLHAAHLGFRKTDHHLTLDCDDAEAAISFCQRSVKVLDDLGWKIKVKPNVFLKTTFALKGQNGIVLQCLNTTLRIFFTK